MKRAGRPPARARPRHAHGRRARRDVASSRRTAILVHRISDAHQPRMAKTLFGWRRKCRPCGSWRHKLRAVQQHPGVSGLAAVDDEPARLHPGRDYPRRTNQTSCTALNCRRSGVGNLESLACVFLRNFHQAYVSGKRLGHAPGHFFPLVHCATSFGNYKEVRKYLIENATLRERVTKILGKIGRLVDGKIVLPEEVVHYSEWVHVMRKDIASKLQKIDVSAPARHGAHGLPLLEDGARGRDLRHRGPRRQPRRHRHRHGRGARRAGRQAVPVVRLLRLRLPAHHQRARVHALVDDRPQDQGRARGGEGRPYSGIDTGCVTTINNQWIGKAHEKRYTMPIMADIQFAALACGADPFKKSSACSGTPAPARRWSRRWASPSRRTRRRTRGTLQQVKAGKMNTSTTRNWRRA